MRATLGDILDGHVENGALHIMAEFGSDREREDAFFKVYCLEDIPALTLGRRDGGRDHQCVLRNIFKIYLLMERCGERTLATLPRVKANKIDISTVSE